MDHKIDFIGYIDGTLDDDETEEIKAHLKNCLQCREMHRLLLSCDDIVDFAARNDPSILDPETTTVCPGINTLIRFILGDLGSVKTAELKDHLQTCTRCEDDVAKLAEAKEAEVEMPEESEWEALPQDLAEMAESAADPLLAKLQDAFFAIKEKGTREVADFVDQVTAAAENILSPPLWAGDEKSLGLGDTDTDIPFSEIESDFEMELEIEGHEVKITRSGDMVKMSVVKDGKPVTGVKLTYSVGTGEQKEIVTGEAGKDGYGSRRGL